jgi:hypothetical protein
LWIILGGRLVPPGCQAPAAASELGFEATGLRPHPESA